MPADLFLSLSLLVAKSEVSDVDVLSRKSPVTRTQARQSSHVPLNRPAAACKGVAAPANGRAQAKVSATSGQVPASRVYYVTAK